MAVVKVWNRNTYDHTEKFKGQEITIRAGQFIEMDYIDAIDFKGQFIPPKTLGPNNPDPQHFKMIEVEQPTEPVVKEDPNVFHATGKAASTPAEMIAFAKAYAAMHPDLKADDPTAEAEGKKTVANLEAEVARLKAQLEGKNKPHHAKRATA